MLAGPVQRQAVAGGRRAEVVAAAPRPWEVLAQRLAQRASVHPEVRLVGGSRRPEGAVPAVPREVRAEAVRRLAVAACPSLGGEAVRRDERQEVLAVAAVRAAWAGPPTAACCPLAVVPAAVPPWAHRAVPEAEADRALRAVAHQVQPDSPALPVVPAAAEAVPRLVAGAAAG